MNRTLNEFVSNRDLRDYRHVLEETALFYLGSDHFVHCSNQQRSKIIDCFFETMRLLNRLIEIQEQERLLRQAG